MSTIKVGDIVETSYNSGKYIGKIIAEKGNFLLTEIIAVLVHPTQGDLHNRGQVEGVAFFERKALAYGEKANVRKRQTKIYEGEIPQYTASLKEALNTLKAELKQEATAFNELSLERLASLEEHYYNKLFEEGAE